MMHYNACMRTTIELSDPVYKRLKSAAIDRGIRGFSPIVEDALRDYFAAEPSRTQMAEAISAARGAWSDMDVEEWERDVSGAWETWRPPPS